MPSANISAQQVFHATTTKLDVGMEPALTVSTYAESFFLRKRSALQIQTTDAPTPPADKAPKTAPLVLSVPLTDLFFAMMVHAKKPSNNAPKAPNAPMALLDAQMAHVLLRAAVPLSPAPERLPTDATTALANVTLETVLKCLSAQTLLLFSALMVLAPA